jgi:hypothetical protein
MEHQLQRCLEKYLDEPDSNKFNPEQNPLV